ncbi:hypothetical protein QLX08_011034 [Tetragonisca angustula]|uniref:Uncharacterized protein n=1 Tax=Tetragonisca angustula TaxID=166442 RepID=A0AAW0Z9K4_9HYME
MIRSGELEVEKCPDEDSTIDDAMLEFTVPFRSKRDADVDKGRVNNTSSGLTVQTPLIKVGGPSARSS